jgi:hypothetical protein
LLGIMKIAAKLLDVGIKPSHCIGVLKLVTALQMSGEPLPHFIDPLLLPCTHVTSRC